MEDKECWIIGAKECGICSQEFDEDARCPRLLTCSHCLCTWCIKHLLTEKTKFCPFCRQEIRGNTIKDFRVNTCVLDLLRYASNLEAGTVLPTGESSSGAWLKAFESSKDAVIKDNLALCQKARDLIVHGQQLNTDFIAELKTAGTEEEELKKEHWGIILFFEDRNDLLENEKDSIEQKHRQMEQMTEKLTLATSLGDASEVMDKAGKLNQEISSDLRRLREFISKDENARQKIKKILQRGTLNIRAVRKFLSSEGSVELLAQFKDLRSLSGDITRPLELQDLLQLSGPIKRLVRSGRVFATQELNGLKRFAKISLTDGKLCQHSLIEEVPPPGSFLTEFSGLSTLDPTTTITFIEVTSLKSFRRCDEWGAPIEFVTLEPVIGKMYFRLFRNDLRCKQFMHLCTGELGPSTSYMNARTVMGPLKLEERISQIRFGDYGDRGKALLEGVSMEGTSEEDQDTSCVRGSMVVRHEEGDDLGGHVYIRLSGIPNFRCDQSFGCVHEGMADLWRVVNSIDEIGYQMKLFISDCGVVLSR
ncbi:uncharacterized protein [Palaemon carinicauda]|uniref:uncharacterized protein n=1 Tax=Palaemon carinicauda TaxID=392227 RepID=UPI0035B62B2B